MYAYGNVSKFQGFRFSSLDNSWCTYLNYGDLFYVCYNLDADSQLLVIYEKIRFIIACRAKFFI